ncbi:hypothetical protein BGW39_008005 [Mortierella sp. 14UC]|nr:hypothetical protein BGW39_008005 [Mortierella sp. 14UC]
MKVTLAVSALIALVATAVSAAPAIVATSPNNSTLSASGASPCTSISFYRHRLFIDNVPGVGFTWNPVSDLHSFELVVGTNFHEIMEKKTSAGNKKNNYKETRTSETKLWKVEHNNEWHPITLTVKGKKYVFNTHNDYNRVDNYATLVYWECVPW